jgi:hypothetical protein
VAGVRHRHVVRGQRDVVDLREVRLLAVLAAREMAEEEGRGVNGADGLAPDDGGTNDIAVRVKEGPATEGRGAGQAEYDRHCAEVVYTCKCSTL